VISGARPYPTYQDSLVPWLGSVPNSWKVRRTKWLFAHMKDLNVDGGQTNILSLTLRGVVNNNPDNPEGLVPKDYRTYQRFEKGDLVFKLIDLENRRTSRVGLVHEDGIMSSAYIRLVKRHRGIQRYFFYQFFDLYQRGVFNQLGAGVRSTLGPTDLLDLPILAPSSTEQAAIVRFLDDVDRRIRRYVAAKRTLMALLDEQKQGIVYRAVTRGLDAQAHLKPSGVAWLDNVPEGWATKRLKQVAVVQTGITLGKSYLNKTLIERPYLRVANVQAGRLDLSKVTTVRLPREEAARSTLRSGDVLMTEGGDIDKLGRGCMWHGEIAECLHQNHIFAVRPRPTDLLPEFLVALMGSPHGRRYFQVTAKQTTNLAATNSTTLGNLPLPLPSVAEQRRILARTAELSRPLEASVDRTQAEIDLIREYGARLTADVVTGKVDIREAAARLPAQFEEQEPLDDGEDALEDDMFEPRTDLETATWELEG
jgi:type I restriction enzyme S subunit